MTQETQRVKLPFPEFGRTNWTQEWLQFMNQLDTMLFAHREDRNLIVASKAAFSWDLGTHLLSWDDPIYVLGAQTGGRWKVPAGSISLDHDGALAIMDLSRAPSGEVEVSITDADVCQQTNAGVVLCERFDTWIIFRTGHSLGDGQTREIFNPFVGPGPTHSHFGEDLTGQIDGFNMNFITTHNYQPNSLRVFLNGVHQGFDGGGQFIETGVDTFTFAYAPGIGEKMFVEYII